MGFFSNSSTDTRRRTTERRTDLRGSGYEKEGAPLGSITMATSTPRLRLVRQLVAVSMALEDSAACAEAIRARFPNFDANVCNP